MNLSATRPSLSKSAASSRVRSGTAYGLIIVLAMIAFESFNFSTTLFALQDLLGNLKFLGVPWYTFLALAFCGIDFAGIARLITPSSRRGDNKESWYLFGAWLLAATANAALTWWGVAVAISGHVLKSSTVVSTHTLTQVVPVFVAILVWVIRILIIGSLTSAIERLNGDKSPSVNVLRTDTAFTRTAPTSRSQPVAAAPLHLTRNPRPASASSAARVEPTYHDLFAARNYNAADSSKSHTNSL